MVRQLHVHPWGTGARKRLVLPKALYQKFGFSPNDELDLYRLVFAMETFVSIRLRLRVASALKEFSMNAPHPDSYTGPDIVRLLQELGAHAAAAGINGYVTDPKFDWWTTGVTEAELRSVEEVARREAAMAASQLGADMPRDAMQDEYHSLFPKELRHALGAYYTPPWLAEHTIARSGWTPESALRGGPLLDPTCGSGVFFVAAARLVWDSVVAQRLTASEAFGVLSRGLIGIDANPLAVLGAQSNLILILSQFAHRFSPEKAEPIRLLVFEGNSLTLSLEDLGVPRAQVVVGNPPWVNWEYLPPAYRADTEGLWPEMGLFSLSGRNRAFSKEDISALFVYVAADRHLQEGGTLSFVLPQSLLQSALNAQSFRTFTIRGEVPMRVLGVDDFVTVKPFEGVTNRTAVLTLTRDESTSYPVPYHRWTRKSRSPTRTGASSRSHRSWLSPKKGPPLWIPKRPGPDRMMGPSGRPVDHPDDERFQPVPRPDRHLHGWSTGFTTFTSSRS